MMGGVNYQSWRVVKVVKTDFIQDGSIGKRDLSIELDFVLKTAWASGDL